MDTVLQAQFHRVEVALGTLVDSIASYNPSPQAAVDLIAADDELSRGLDQLAQHQANHARIQALRAEAEALESQLRTSVSALASLRRELFETPATTFPEDSRPVKFDELLQYAKNIARYTVPPTYRERIPTPPPPKGARDKEGEDGATSGAATNAVNTPAHPTTRETAEAEPGAEAEPKEITPEEEEWLRKLTEGRVAWVPYPSNDKIRRGGLMQIQYLLDTGKDPQTIDCSKMAEAEKERIAMEADRQAQAQAIQSPKMAPMEIEPPAPAAPRPPQEPQQLYTGFDFAEEDEEGEEDGE